MTNHIFDAREDEFDDCDDDCFDGEPDEYEDEQAELRGTSACDGLCDPQCSWCLVAHYCPDECSGGVCPYESLGVKRADTSPINT